MYDVAVIGSGYGGAAVAARLAAHGRVLVIERGGWWRPGEFPETVAALARTRHRRGDPDGLWGVRLGAGTGVGYASAFGGSSAINYGITIRPADHAFAGWPVTAAELAPWFERAERALGATPNPRAVALPDGDVLDALEPGARIDLANTIDWPRCDDCGRCVPGCNAGAKRSLDRSYLATALAAGAALRLATEVREIAIAPDGYRLHLRRRGGGGAEWVPARRVVLAAGTLGTHDLLHRSAIPLGPRFGRDLSLNGDGLAFLYDSGRRLTAHRGAPISTAVRLTMVDGDGARRTLLAMSGRVPQAALRFAGAALAAIAGVAIDPAAPRDHRAGRWARRLRDLIAIGDRGALARTLMYKLDGQDQGRGTVRFTPTGAVIDWPDYADDPILRFAAARLRAWAGAIGGVVVPDVARLPGFRSFSVHPLGGCRLGADLADGVVDPLGRVFAPAGGVYPGLRIADGAIVRGSLGVPPSLTIAALAERIAADLERELLLSRTAAAAH
ncbi:MAG: GMC family oxidoreductase [Myxococcales bacterium]|nr:GMC family oxidoreductase [Myxococcales bacterium]